MMTPSAPIHDAISFGPFSLVANQRQLTRDGTPVELGGRTFDILLALLSRPNEVISKSDLMAQVWSDVTVEEGSLRFHIASLRKALGDGKDGARYITTTSGRGYCFVAPISRSSDRGQDFGKPRADILHTNLPARLLGMIGRNDDVLEVSARLNAVRFITIVGSGGVGKTTVAIAVGHHLIEAFEGAVLFVDLSTLRDPDLMPAIIASMLGFTVSSADALPSLVASLRDRRILLILDTCEHVIEAAATLASRIFTEAPQVHILATSRETLRTEGEQVYRLDPLACPPDDVASTALVAQTFPATRLFVERAVASGARLDLDDAEAAVVVAICRKLEGVALAIELAARRVEAYGLHQTATLLDTRLNLLWVGRRTAPPRQKTLQATLDWSYDLLSEFERRVLRRLAVFVGPFTLDAAMAVVTSPNIDQAIVFGAINNLVAKSLIAAPSAARQPRYRLLDATRAFTSEKLAEGGEADQVSRAHAHYFNDFLREVLPGLRGRDDFLPYADNLPNLRAALDWSFSDHGDRILGVNLAATAAQLFLELSLLTECYRWTHRALAEMQDSLRGTQLELDLQAALVISGMFSKGNTPEVDAAIARGIELAQALGDKTGHLRLLLCFHIVQIRSGATHRSLEIARQALTIAQETGDQTGIAVAHRMHGISCALSGDRIAAIRHFELGFSHDPRNNAIDFLGDTHRMGALVAYARTLWMRGHSSRAVALAKEAVLAINPTSHPVSACNCCAYVAHVFLWAADYETARRVIDQLIEYANRYSFAAFQSLGLGLKGQLDIALREHQAGKSQLEAALNGMQAEHQNTLVAASFRTSLAEARAATGDFDGALEALKVAQTWAEETGVLYHLPETLRLRGEVLSSKPDGDLAEAEAVLLQSFDLARSQGSPGLEIRSAVTLAELHVKRGEREKARILLLDLCNKFSESRETGDLSVARRMIETLDP